MSPIVPLLCIPVGVVVERRKANSPWAEFVWRPVAVLAGIPEARPWTILASDGEAVTFYAGAGEIELYRSETANYRDNLGSGEPSVWVALRESGSEPPYDISCITADPAEGEALTEPAHGIVEAVAMPERVYQVLAGFVADYHVERPFQKRNRDRANPEALAHRDPSVRRRDDR